eukprot:symbB.v1.2.027810.t1/scaffold2884.1/size68011/2
MVGCPPCMVPLAVALVALEKTACRNQAADSPFTEDGVQRMTDYVDVFLEYNLVKKGFSIVYDLRLLRVPSLALVKQLADWGRDPQRQQTFQRLNKSCKVVVSEGWRMGVARRILAAFFAMCPPVCDTYLLTAVDQPTSDGLYFAPPALPASEGAPASAPQAEPKADQSCKSSWWQSALDFVAQPTGPPLVHAAHYCPSISGPHA